MAKTVWYVPGLGGTQLYLTSHRTQLYWVSYLALAIGGPETASLSADGVTPLPPDGRPLFPGDPLPAYYGQAVDVLRDQLTAEGYELRTFGYDFRRHPYDVGLDLAAEIRESGVTIGDAVIIGHSMGGLVARAAWTDLGRTGDQGLVRRIITLGTPHWGSYGGIEFWSAAGSMSSAWVDAAVYWSGSPALVAGSAAAQHYIDRVIASLLTWPSIYDLLPLLDAGDAFQDPHRAALFGAGQWHGRDGPISADLLRHSAEVTGVWLRSPASMPPPHILTVVAGGGFDTFEALDDPSRLGLDGALRSTLAGDGTVTVASAMAGQPVSVLVVCQHNALPAELSVSGLLFKLVMDERVPPAPLPAPVVLRTPSTVLPADAPLQQPQRVPMAAAPCPDGCMC